MKSIKALNTVDNFDPSEIQYEQGDRPHAGEPNLFLALKQESRGKLVNKVWTLEDGKFVGVFESKKKAGQYSALFVWDDTPYAKKLVKFFDDQAAAVNALPQDVKKRMNFFHNPDKVKALQKKGKNKDINMEEEYTVSNPLYYDEKDNKYKLFTFVSVFPFTNPKDGKVYEPVHLNYMNPRDRKQSKISLLKLEKMHVQCDYIKIALEVKGKVSDTGMANLNISAKCFDIITTHKPVLMGDNGNAELLAAALEKRGGVEIEDEDDNNVDIASLLDSNTNTKPNPTIQSLEAPKSSNAHARTMGDEEGSDEESEEEVKVKSKKTKKSAVVFPSK